MTAGDEVSEETRLLVTSVRGRAATVPDAGVLAGLLSAPRRNVPDEEVRRLGREALSQSQQMSFLLGKLAGLLRDGETP